MCTASAIEKLPDLLKWAGDDSTFDWIHDRYRRIVSEALGRLVAEVNRDDQEFGQSLLDALAESSDEAVLRVVLAPQTSHLLLWNNPAT